MGEIIRLSDDNVEFPISALSDEERLTAASLGLDGCYVISGDDPTRYVYCTREAKHAPPHVASGLGEVIVAWFSLDDLPTSELISTLDAIRDDLT